MTPEKRAKLTKQLADHGLSVLLTRDFDSILIQLARLAQFERLMETKAEYDKRLAEIIKMIRLIQGPDNIAHPENNGPCRSMDILDIPAILPVVNRALHVQLDKKALIDLHATEAATAAFIGILCRPSGA